MDRVSIVIEVRFSQI